MRKNEVSTPLPLGTILPKLCEIRNHADSDFVRKGTGKLEFVRRQMVLYSMSVEIGSISVSLPIWFINVDLPSKENLIWIALQCGSLDAFSHLNALMQDHLEEYSQQMKSFGKFVRLKCWSEKSEEKYTGWIYSYSNCQIAVPDSMFHEFTKPPQRGTRDCSQLLVLHLDLSLEPVSISKDEFSALAVGDCLLLKANSSSESCRVLIGLRHNTARFFGSYEKGYVMVEEELSVDDFEDESSTVIAENAFDDDVVLLHSYLPPKVLTLSELCALEVGSLIEVGHNANEATLILKVGSRTIGQGRLVALGDRLAIQLLSLRSGASEVLE
jgi:hypothetical protein